MHRVVAGNTVLDPKVVSGLLSHAQRSEAISRLTPREREVLGLMAEGLKLDLPDVPDQNRRVLAVLTYLQQQ